MGMILPAKISPKIVAPRPRRESPKVATRDLDGFACKSVNVSNQMCWNGLEEQQADFSE